VERLQLQLAACGVVAMANTPDSAARQRDMHPDYMSASCQDVIRAVDREMALREERDQLKALNESLWETFFHVAEMLGIDYDKARKHPGKPSDVYREALAAHDAEMIDRLKTEMMTYVAKLNMQPGVEFAVDFMDDKIDQLRQQAKEVQS
jgi:hypothetical protein